MPANRVGTRRRHCRGEYLAESGLVSLLDIASKPARKANRLVRTRRLGGVEGVPEQSGPLSRSMVIGFRRHRISFARATRRWCVRIFCYISCRLRTRASNGD